jgi:LacI family transcriptional regulator
MDDLSAFCCLNPACADLGKRGHGNLTVTMRYGPNKSRRLLRCSTCTARFSERKGTPLFDARLPPGKVTAVLAHVAEGIGTRKTARLTGVNKDTVTRYTRLAGDHAEQLHDELVPFSPQDRRGPVRREVGVRRKKAEELPTRRRPAR